MIKSGVELLAEAAKSDDFNVNSDVNDVIREAKEALTSCIDLNEEIPMTPEMIPITRQGEYYTVDFSSVFAAASDMKADIGNIMNSIIGINNEELEKQADAKHEATGVYELPDMINTENLVVAVESAEYFDQLIEEAKCGGKLGEKAKCTLAKATETIKNMKKAGIKVAKKKSKKK